MIVYHGSNCIVDYPDIYHSFHNLDFGKGFYATSNRQQAERWARRKSDLKKSSKAIVNIYNMNNSMKELKVLDFGENLYEWIDFVCQCRDGKTGYQQYDIIIGKVANDKVFRVVDMYHSGIWDKDRALKEIKVYPTYDQIAFITQKAIWSSLQFQKYEEV